MEIVVIADEKNIHSIDKKTLSITEYYLSIKTIKPPCKNTLETKAKGCWSVLLPHDIEHDYCRVDTQFSILYDE
jgi:hypothetical protein